MSKHSAALSKAVCAVAGATISGSRMPSTSRPQSRWVFTASRMLSVPPEVTVPTTPGVSSAPSIAAVMATISASYFVVLGHSAECNGLVCELRAYTRSRNSMCSGSPL